MNAHVFFIASAHVFYYKKLVQKPSRKKAKKKSRPKKKLGQKLEKNLTKNQYKIQNNNAGAFGARPKNGAAPSAPPHFWGCCYEF